MIDISTEGILFLGEVEKHRLKKLVTCDWEVLPMTGHQFFMDQVILLLVKISALRFLSKPFY